MNEIGMVTQDGRKLKAGKKYYIVVPSQEGSVPTIVKAKCDEITYSYSQSLRAWFKSKKGIHLYKCPPNDWPKSTPIFCHEYIFTDTRRGCKKAIRLLALFLKQFQKSIKRKRKFQKRT